MIPSFCWACFTTFYVSMFIAAKAKKSVVLRTPQLAQQGFQSDINLGDVVAEHTVTSSQTCVDLCRNNHECRSVMLTGQLCRLLRRSHQDCPVS